MKKLKILLLFVFILLSCEILAKNLDATYINMKEKVTIIQSKCSKCTDLINFSCAKNKIHCCFKIDQYVRNNSKLFWENQEFFDFVQKVDFNNTNILKSILKIHGWPTISKFGKRTDQEAWLLVQHADHDLEFQASIAFILEQLSMIGETDLKNFAYLYDRVANNFNMIGIKQKYGTQAIIENKTIKLAPFVGDIRELDERRKMMRLIPIKEYLNQLGKFYKLKVIVENNS